jgi:hypothetical protein
MTHADRMGAKAKDVAKRQRRTEAGVKSTRIRS